MVLLVDYDSLNLIRDTTPNCNTISELLKLAQN